MYEAFNELIDDHKTLRHKYKDLKSLNQTLMERINLVTKEKDKLIKEKQELDHQKKELEKLSENLNKDNESLNLRLNKIKLFVETFTLSS